MVIVWSNPALHDLRLIHQFIARDSKHYASQVVQDITDKVQMLSEFPFPGRMVPEINEENVREIGMYSYRIMYELTADKLVIHGIFHKRSHFMPQNFLRK